jgi:hypothetical protein
VAKVSGRLTLKFHAHLLSASEREEKYYFLSKPLYRSTSIKEFREKISKREGESGSRTE